MLETIFKIIITLIIGIFLVWIWKSHIDVKATFVNLFKSKVAQQTEWISTRQENTIYQDDQLVGKIAGTINEENGKLIFAELYETGSLDRSKPFEYKRTKCKIINIEAMSGIKVSNTPEGNFTQKSNVLENVTCEKI